MTVTGSRTSPATLDEVAVLAGVSRATVSRVVNNSPRVSPEARDAVRAAITELRYVPNRAARSLVTRRSQTIGVLGSELSQYGRNSTTSGVLTVPFEVGNGIG